jgi:hypothetical protein
MITIELTNASNGLIKKITDTNYNGAGERFEEVVVYQIDNKEHRFEAITGFLYEISADLGLDLGSDFSGAQLSIDLDWGDEYVPRDEEIDLRIKSLQDEIKFLKALKKSKEGNI